MLPLSTLLAGIDLADRQYWLGHCEGFRVRAGDRRFGVVGYVRHGADPSLPDSIHICTGILRVREVAVPVADVEDVDAPRRTLWVRERRDVPARRRTLPNPLRRAGARLRWAGQRG